MRLAQLTLDKVEIQNDSVPLLVIQGSPRVDLSGAGTEHWIVQLVRELGRPGRGLGGAEEGTKDLIIQFLRKQGQINLERMRFEPHYTTARPEVFIFEAPRYESTTAPTDFEVHLTPGEETLSVEGDILRGEFMEPRPTPSSTLSRIQARQPQILRRALEIRQEYGDPIQNLAELLGNMPGSQEDWEALIDEPYY
jgi:hypothetical protein